MSSMIDSVILVNRETPSSRVQVVPPQCCRCVRVYRGSIQRTRCVGVLFGRQALLCSVILAGSCHARKVCPRIIHCNRSRRLLRCLQGLGPFRGDDGVVGVARSLAVRIVEVSRRFEVVRRGQLTDGGSSFRKLLSSFAQISGSVFTLNFLPVQI